jgi:putative redox protein
VDNRSEFGGDDLGASPMELVLIGGMHIDMISILKKRQEISSFKAEVEGERVQSGRSHLKIFMLFYLEGDIKRILQSCTTFFEKYCRF